MEYLENRTLVLPFDFSEPSQAAIDHALELAEDSTSLHVIHVIEPVSTVVSFDPASPVPPAYDHGRFREALARMRELFGSGKYERIKIHCVVGGPATEIIHLADKLRADMIVMPTHGRSGFTRLMLGSVTERVLRKSNCPVLVLRHPESE